MRANTWRMFLALLTSLVFMPVTSLCAEVPVAVSTSTIEDLGSSSQIVRTSSGRLYYFSGIDTSDGSGRVDVHSSAEGQEWIRINFGGSHRAGAAISAAVDDANVIHMVTYDTNGHPYYQRLNSADSPKGTQQCPVKKLHPR